MGHIYWGCCLNATSLSPLATSKAVLRLYRRTAFRYAGFRCGFGAAGHPEEVAKTARFRIAADAWRNYAPWFIPLGSTYHLLVSDISAAMTATALFRSRFCGSSKGALTATALLN
jgi:hypothetical protein